MCLPFLPNHTFIWLFVNLYITQYKKPKYPCVCPGHSKAYEALEQEAQVLMFGPDPHNPPRFKKPLGEYSRAELNTTVTQDGC